LDYSLRPSFYYTVRNLCHDLIKAQQDRLETTGLHPVRISVREFEEDIRKARIVVLDELGGRTQTTDHHYEAVKMVLDEREGQPLILITNLIPADLAAVYDDRIASRCAAGTVVDLSQFPDRRLGSSSLAS
jgi:chromosomal replication initiation ATPase DnaA